MIPDVDAWTEFAFLHGLVEFTPRPRRRHIATQSGGRAEVRNEQGEADLVGVGHARDREGDRAEAEAATAIIRRSRGVKLPAGLALTSRSVPVGSWRSATVEFGATILKKRPEIDGEITI
jgi:hypothetical protein